MKADDEIRLGDESINLFYTHHLLLRLPFSIIPVLITFTSRKSSPPQDGSIANLPDDLGGKGAGASGIRRGVFTGVAPPSRLYSPEVRIPLTFFFETDRLSALEVDLQSILLTQLSCGSMSKTCLVLPSTYLEVDEGYERNILRFRDIFVRRE